MKYILFFCLCFLCLNKMTLFTYDYNNCKNNADCNDGNSCTIDVCTYGGKCHHHFIPTCCNSLFTCEAMSACYEGYCDENDPDMPQCRQIKKPLCCQSDDDCTLDHPNLESLVWYCNMTKHPDPNPKKYEGTCYHKFKQFYCETDNDCDHLSVQDDCLNWECHSSGNCTIENFKPLCCTDSEFGCCQNSPCVESYCNTDLVDDPENSNEGICDTSVIEDCDAICEKPMNLEGTMTQNKNNFSKCKAELTWEAPDNDCDPTTYHLYVQQEDENWKPIDIIIDPTTTWNGDVVCRDDTLKFKLTAHNINEEGDSTEIVLTK